ncbi:TPA: LOW QUALITY PROTEIN: hypothetical protein N0F65_008871, partial [Lagenidium giganteum]
SIHAGLHLLPDPLRPVHVLDAYQRRQDRFASVSFRPCPRGASKPLAPKGRLASSKAKVEETLKTWYPTVKIGSDNATLVVPSIEDSVVFYNSEKELEDYVTSKAYGTVATKPRIYGALIFDKYPTNDAQIGKFGSLEYTVRLNATGVYDDDSAAYTPHTQEKDGASTWRAYDRKLDNKLNSMYASSGFMTLQTLVARFANCMPGWDAAKKAPNGKCQVEEATALSSEDLDNRMSDYLLTDPSIKSAWSDMVWQAHRASGSFDAPTPNITLSKEARAALFRPLRQAPQPYLGSTVSPFPIEGFKTSSFYDLIKTVFPLVFMLGNMHPLSKMLVNFISERETRSRELMKILGVKESSLVTSWYVMYFVILLLSAILQTVVSKMGLFAFSSGALLFLFFFLFSLSLLGFGFMISSIFSKSRTGVYIGVIAFFVMYSVSNAFSDRSSELSKSIACLLSPVGLVFGVNALAAVETNETGMSFANAGIRVINFRFSTALIFFAIDAVLYTLIGLYLEKVVPKEFGTTEKWYFPLQPSYWCRHPTIAQRPEEIDEDVAAEAHRVASGQADDDAIKLANLRKVYRLGHKVAVKDLSFGLKKGECFGFLGINGAGKTTTMKMLTGDIVPTSGNATLAGFDILTQQLEVRREIGYCPQFDALIDLLTVREHLELFGRIKGIPSAELENVVYEKMQQLNLMDFENKLAGSLSGGNKRKLSVAIAMIGSPSILFLDEPSTGMDPVSRRFMWDVIAEISTHNKESTVVLTTHSMEECEALCTRVGIMVGGGLKCLGSIQHLKGRFGDGLMLDAKLSVASSREVEQMALRHFDGVNATISQAELSEKCALLGQPSWEQKIDNTHVTGHTLANQMTRDGYVTAAAFVVWWLSETKFEAFSRFLRDHFGSVELLERQNDSCWFKLRETPNHQGALRLSNVFDLVENAKASLSIREYSVSQTTLEQIFNAFASQQNAGAPISSTPTNAA